MKNFKALVKYFDRKSNKMIEVTLDVKADSIESAWKEAKASFTTISVVEA